MSKPKNEQEWLDNLQDKQLFTHLREGALQRVYNEGAFGYGKYWESSATVMNSLYREIVKRGIESAARNRISDTLWAVIKDVASHFETGQNND